MVLYNVTVNIDASVKDEWLEWMRTVHIPEVMGTGCFVESRILRVEGEEQGGLTYAIAYLSPSVEQYEKYQEKFAPGLQREHSERYQGKFAAFRTILHVVEEFKE